MIDVLIADDQALVRGGFRMILDAQSDIDVVGEAEDGVQALTLVHELSPDLVLMDVRMPRLDGLEATRRIVAEELATAVLDPDDLRRRRDRLRSAPRRGEWLPPQKRPACPSGGSCPPGGHRRGPARTDNHPAPDRRIRSPAPTRLRHRHRSSRI